MILNITLLKLPQQTEMFENLLAIPMMLPGILLKPLVCMLEINKAELMEVSLTLVTQSLKDAILNILLTVFLTQNMTSHSLTAVNAYSKNIEF